LFWWWISEYSWFSLLWRWISGYHWFSLISWWISLIFFVLTMDYIYCLRYLKWWWAVVDVDLNPTTGIWPDWKLKKKNRDHDRF
jgi:hypothetical protein